MQIDHNTLFNHFRITPYAPCAFGLHDGKTWKHPITLHACHSALTRTNPNVGYLVAGLYPGNCPPDVCDQYFRFILSKDSPWGLDCKTIEHEGKLIAWEIAYPKRDPVIANLAIATRMPIEKANHLALWSKLVKDGFTPTEALYVAAQMAFKDKTKVTYYHHMGGHWAWDTGFNNKMLCNRFLKHDPDKTSTSINGIWNKSLIDPKKVDPYFGSSITSFPLYPIVNVQPVASGMFAAFKRNQNTKGIKIVEDYDELVKRLKETRNEWE